MASYRCDDEDSPTQSQTPQVPLPPHAHHLPPPLHTHTHTPTTTPPSPAQDDASKPEKAKWRFLQKYWHKGAFFQDEAGESSCPMTYGGCGGLHQPHVSLTSAHGGLWRAYVTTAGLAMVIIVNHMIAHLSKGCCVDKQWLRS
jgi:hypothetical protein